MTRSVGLLVATALLCAGEAFQTTTRPPAQPATPLFPPSEEREVVLRPPVTTAPLSRPEIVRRLGLKEDPDSGALSLGAGPHMGYALDDEREVLCPASGAPLGVLCAAALPSRAALVGDDATMDAIANDHALVAQAIAAGALAASVRRRRDRPQYFLPSVITLVDSLMADEVAGLDWADAARRMCGGRDDAVVLYARAAHADESSAMAEVYVLPRDGRGALWMFEVEFKVAAINLQAIASFGRRDSTTPLRPDVWLKNDSY